MSSNTTSPGDNSTIPDGNTTSPGDNSTIPDGNTTSPGGNSTDGNSTIPDGNTTIPDGNSSLPDGNSSMPSDSLERDCINGSYTGMDLVCESPCAISPCTGQQVCMFDREQERGCRCEDVAPTYGVCTVIVVVIVLPPGQAYGEVKNNVHNGLQRNGMKHYGVAVGPAPSGSDNHVTISILCFPDSSGTLNSSEATAHQALTIINSQSQSIHYETAGDAEVTTQRTVTPTNCSSGSGWSDNSTSADSCASSSSSSSDDNKGMKGFMKFGLWIVVAVVVLLLLCLIGSCCGCCKK
jgi:hypothetical protein